MENTRSQSLLGWSFRINYNTYWAVLAVVVRSRQSSIDATTMVKFGLSEKHTKICAIFLMLCIPIYFVKNSFRLSWCIKDLRGTKFMYYYVLKWPVFRLQRGSAKSHLAPSDFSSLCQRRGSIQCVPIWTFLGFLQPSKGKNLLFCYIKWHFLGTHFLTVFELLRN